MVNPDSCLLMEQKYHSPVWFAVALATFRQEQ
jgi:hypothetical protein